MLQVGRYGLSLLFGLNAGMVSSTVAFVVKTITSHEHVPAPLPTAGRGKVWKAHMVQVKAAHCKFLSRIAGENWLDLPAVKTREDLGFIIRI